MENVIMLKNSKQKNYESITFAKFIKMENNMEKIIKPRKDKQKTSFESIALTTMKAGMFFYTHRHDKDITAISSHYNKKVKTERLWVIDPKTGVTEKVVKVTIL